MQKLFLFTGQWMMREIQEINFINAKTIFVYWAMDDEGDTRN